MTTRSGHGRGGRPGDRRRPYPTITRSPCPPLLQREALEEVPDDVGGVDRGRRRADDGADRLAERATRPRVPAALDAVELGGGALGLAVPRVLVDRLLGRGVGGHHGGGGLGAAAVPRR